MKTIYNSGRTFLMTVALSAVAAFAVAQDVNRELTLEREYDPSVQDANKVNTLPAIKEPVVNKLTIDYSDFTIPTEPQRELGILPSGNVMTDIDFNKRRGYLNLGVGNYLNINGDVGYHILSTNVDQLRVFFSHRSSKGNLTFNQEEYDDMKTKAKLNDNLGGIDYRHQFQHAALKLGARYGYNAFNYYGLPSLSKPVYDAEPSNGEYYLFDVDNQVNQLIKVNAGVESEEDAAVGYLLDLQYANFDYKYGPSIETDGITEHSIGGKLGMSGGFGGNQRVGIAGSFNYFNYNRPEDSNVSFWNYFEGTLNPYYIINGDNWHIKLGAKVMLITGDSSKFFVSPDIAMDVTVGGKTTLYLKADGDIRSNSAYQLSRENRYIDPARGVMPSRTWLDAEVGVKCGVAPGFWFNIFGGYKITDKDYFFVPQFSSVGFQNVSHALSLDSKRLRAGVELKYNYQKLFEIMVKGVYNNWNMEDVPTHDGIASREEYKAYGRPEFELGAGVTVRPFDGLSLGLDYNLQTGRYTTYMPKQTGEYIFKSYVNEKMKDISELNFTGTYAINDTFGAFVKVNNILSQKYEMQFGYPMHRINFMAGININF